VVGLGTARHIRSREDLRLFSLGHYRRKLRFGKKYALEQIPRLLALLREPVRTMVLLGILTGMRIGEILGCAEGM
jgi:integrase